MRRKTAMLTAQLIWIVPLAVWTYLMSLTKFDWLFDLLVSLFVGLVVIMCYVMVDARILHRRHQSYERTRLVDSFNAYWGRR